MKVKWIVSFCAAALAAPVAAHAVSYNGCGVHFDYPSDWHIAKGDDEETRENFPCQFRLQPLNLAERMKKNRGEDNYTVTIEIHDTSWEEETQNASFEKKDDGSWVALGRQGIEGEAHAVSKPYYQGIVGSTAAGCFNDDGYAGLCDLSRALVGRSDRSIVINAYDDEMLQQLLNSLRFTTDEK